MKYLLLGGAGFIGTHLSHRLIKDGHDVTVIDSLVTSTTPTHIVNFVHKDLATDDVEEYISDADIVYFLAGSVGVLNVVNNPATTLRNNINLVTKLLPLFEKYNKKVVFSSTSEVYGNGPFVESGDLSIGPPSDLRWGYAAAKLATEFMITSSSFPYVIVRFFNITGPGQLGDYGMVLPRFVNAAVNGEDITVFGSGEQVRSFCHINDAVEMLLDLERKDNIIVNVGNNEPITIRELADTVVRVIGSTSKIKMTPIAHSDINTRIPDLTRLHSLTKVRPKHTLEDIIKDML